MKRKPLKSAILFLTLLILTSCKMDFINKTLTGKGPVMEKTFSLDHPFDALSAHQSWKVKLIQSDDPHLVVRTQENIFPVFSYSIKNGELNLGLKKNTNLRKVKVQEIDVYYKNLSNIQASSSAKVHSSEVFNQKQIALKASSSSTIDLQLKTGLSQVKGSSSSSITLSGTSKDFKANISSSGQLKAGGLKTKTASLQASSSGSITAQALKTLEAKASSSATIKVMAQTETGQVKTSSSGEIKLKGYCQTFQARANSSGSVNAKNLVTQTSNLKASTGASISVDVRNSIIAETSTGGSINYKGNPSEKTLDQGDTGGGIRAID